MKTSQHQEVLRKIALTKICRLRQTVNFYELQGKTSKFIFSISFLKKLFGNIFHQKERINQEIRRLRSEEL